MTTIKYWLFIVLALVLICPNSVLAAAASSTSPAAAGTATSTLKTADIDSDGDGLSDINEMKFKADSHNPDSDHDGYPDGLEVKNGYDPNHGSGAKLLKRIEVDTKTERLRYYLGDVELGEYPVSTGVKSLPTPKGNFTVKNKSVRARSATYKLWMPYWLGLSSGGVGIHELPEWDSGYKEPATHLGEPASHGCIRLGVGPAKTLYDWTPVGTAVKIY
jgi:hypothetical protein